MVARTGDGGWPTSHGTEDAAEGEDDHLDTALAIASHLADGEVLILMQCGHEKLRYLDASVRSSMCPSKYAPKCRIARA